ncbi:MAG TPA: hypothetical protein VJ898_14245 [Natrialbaceae archaeon]|nr:hypothetical protein [Natrialbaceae archaeon]
MGFRGWVLIVAVVLVLSGCLVDPVAPTAQEHDRHLSNIPKDDPVTDQYEGTASDGVLEVGDIPVPDEDGTDRPVTADEGLRLYHQPRGESVTESPVVVGVVNSANRTRNVTALIDRAITYWEENDERYVDYEVDFELDPDAESPDVIVSFQRTVECQGEAGWLGCAPDVEAIDATSDTMVVSIKSGYRDNSTVRTIQHEFGHLLGLDHGDAPMPLMSPQQESLKLQQPDASGRTFPWADRNLTVYTDYSTLSPNRRMDAAKQVSLALDYYENHANSSRWANVSFTATRNPAVADVRIDFDSDSSLLQGAGSIGRPKGPDVDGDGSVEYYTESRIVVSNVRTEAIGWHVGYWIGVSLGARNTSELPEPFRNGTRTGKWWR